MTDRDLWHDMPTAERAAYVLAHLLPGLLFLAVLAIGWY